jgi:hypothetical protein
MVEMIGSRRTSLMTSLLFTFDSFLFIACSLDLKYIAKDTQVFIWTGLIIALVTAVLLAVQRFPESLKFTFT